MTGGAPSPVHRVHGLSAEEVPPDWPPLTLQELERLLAHFPQLGSAQQILWHSPRPLSAAALVTTEKTRVFIKRHHVSVRSAACLQEEHAFAYWLREHGIPIAPIFITHEGQSAITLGDWTYEVHATAQGIDLYRDTMSWVPLHDLNHARTAGSMLARLHHAAQGFVAPQRSTHLLVARSEVIEARDAPTLLEQQFAQRPALAAYLATQPTWREQLQRTLQPFAVATRHALATQPRLWTHGDWHASNLFWNATAPHTHITGVLDFSLCARTFALFDLATAIERSAIAWLEPETQRAHPHIALAILAGYNSVRPISTHEHALLLQLLPFVHVDFALSEVEYFFGVLHAPAHANVAWHTFLHGHAAWFQTREGISFLHALNPV